MPLFGNKLARARALCLAAAAILSILVLSAEAATPYVLYSDGPWGAQGEWRDYSWDARLVDFRSSPGFDGASAIDAAIRGHGAFALARVKLPDAGAQSSPRGGDNANDNDNANDDEPAFVSASDPLAARLSMRVQGPLKSSQGRLKARSANGGSSSEGEGDDQWLFLTDGRVIPKVANRLTVKRAPAKYTKPASLSDIALYLEDSRSGRASQAVLLSHARALGPQTQPRVDVSGDISEPRAWDAPPLPNFVDDSGWTELEVDLPPLLRAAGMRQWDKLVLKDTKGKGFNIRLDAVQLLAPTTTDADADADADATFEGEGEEVASIYAKGDAPPPVASREKVIHNWLSEDSPPAPEAGSEPDADGAGRFNMSDAEVVRRNALQAFQSPTKCAAYSSPLNVASIKDGGLKEPSGLAASRRYQGILWTHQDRDTSPYLYAVAAETGQVVGKYVHPPLLSSFSPSLSTLMEMSQTQN